MQARAATQNRLTIAFQPLHKPGAEQKKKKTVLLGQRLVGCFLFTVDLTTWSKQRAARGQFQQEGFNPNAEELLRSEKRWSGEEGEP